MKQNVQYREEERKYQNNEDFTLFIRKQVITRKIAGIFQEMRVLQQKRKAEAGVTGFFVSHLPKDSPEKDLFIKDEANE